MLRLFRITDAFNVNKRQLAISLVDYNFSTGCLGRQRSLVVTRPRWCDSEPLRPCRGLGGIVYLRTLAVVYRELI